MHDQTRHCSMYYKLHIAFVARWFLESCSVSALSALQKVLHDGRTDSYKLVPGYSANKTAGQARNMQPKAGFRLQQHGFSVFDFTHDPKFVFLMKLKVFTARTFIGCLVSELSSSLAELISLVPTGVCSFQDAWYLRAVPNFLFHICVRRRHAQSSRTHRSHSLAGGSKLAVS